MKKLYSFLMGIVAIILVLWGVSYHIESRIKSGNGDKLVIYNWGDYIDPELLMKFSRKPVSKSNMKPLIPTNPCTLRLSRAGQLTILQFLVNT